MIFFKDCSHLCYEDGADEKFMNFVTALNEHFGERSCACHPDVTWEVAVDLLANCKYDFHTNDGENPNCKFWERLLENEVKAFTAKV